MHLVLLTNNNLGVRKETHGDSRNRFLYQQLFHEANIVTDYLEAVGKLVSIDDQLGQILVFRLLRNLEQ
jgi:hypothetical protein